MAFRQLGQESDVYSAQLSPSSWLCAAATLLLVQATMAAVSGASAAFANNKQAAEAGFRKIDLIT